MSEQLTIEILRKKFKEAQNGEFDLLCTFAELEVRLIDIGINYVYYRHVGMGNFGYVPIVEFLDNWKIKQPKDEYEVVYLSFYRRSTYFGDLYFIGNIEEVMPTTVRLLRNKRTGEIVEYDEELLK